MGLGSEAFCSRVICWCPPPLYTTLSLMSCEGNGNEQFVLVSRARREYRLVFKNRPGHNAECVRIKAVCAYCIGALGRTSFPRCDGAERANKRREYCRFGGWCSGVILATCRPSGLVSWCLCARRTRERGRGREGEREREIEKHTCRATRQKRGWTRGLSHLAVVKIQMRRAGSARFWLGHLLPVSWVRASSSTLPPSAMNKPATRGIMFAMADVLLLKFFWFFVCFFSRRTAIANKIA